MRRSVDPKRGRIRIGRRQLVAHGFRQRILDNDVAALAGEQPHQRDLVILVRLDLQLAPIVTVWEQGLIQLRDLEGTAQQVRIAHPDILHEPAKHAVQIIHG